MLPIPTRPGLDRLSQEFSPTIAVNTVPASPTSNLSNATKQSKVLVPSAVIPPDTNNFLLIVTSFSKVTLPSLNTSMSAYNLP